MKKLKNLLRKKPAAIATGSSVSSSQPHEGGKPPVVAKIQSVDVKSSQQPSAQTISFPDGLKMLHDCPDATVDICFVHGLTGNRDSTWTAEGQTTPWPKTLVPPRLNTARILTYGYDAYIVRRLAASSNRLMLHAVNLVADLTADRAASNASFRPLIFVAHSLGGLVCKEAILLSRNNPEHHLCGIFDCTKGFIFMGTPHRGSWMADWAKIPASALGLVKSTNTTLLDILQRDNQFLESIQLRFWAMVRQVREAGRRLEVTCFFEELPMPLVGKVVSEHSATLEGYNLMSIHANHRDMARFRSSEDTGFKRLLGELVRWEAQLRPSEVSGSTRKRGIEATRRTETGSSQWSLNDIERSCMALFSDFDVADYWRMLPRPVQGTCRWILSQPQFHAWFTQTSTSLLWLTGHSGCGKTTVSSFLAQHLEEAQGGTHTALVCIHFCDGKTTQRRDALAILKSIIFQIIRRHQSLVRYVKRVYEVQGYGLSGSFSSLWNIFERIASELKSGLVYVIIDALDECADLKTRDIFLQSVSKLVDGARSPNTTHSCIKFLFTSRPSLSETNMFNASLCSRLVIDETQSGHRHDVRLVIQDRVEQLAQNYDWSPGLKDFLQETLLSRADHTFLWVHLILQSLEETFSTARRDFIAITSQLPRGLKSTYERFLMATPSGYEDKASKLVNLIVGSSRYLNLDEINIAFTVSSAEKTTQAVGLNCQTSMARLLQGVLGPLIRIVESRVSLVHQSAKEFLLQLAFETENQLSPVYGVHEHVAALTIATASVLYLLLDDFSVDLFCVEDSPIESIEDLSANLFTEHEFVGLAHGTIFRDNGFLDKEKCQATARRYGFFGYSAVHWAQHYAAVQDLATPEMRRAARTLLDPTSAHCTNWLKFYWLESHVEHDVLPDFDALSLAAYFNIRHILVELLETEASYPQSGKDSAVIWASRMGHSKSVEILMQAGAEPNYQTADRQSALTVASQGGHVDAVQLLLSDQRTDVNIRGKSGRTPLSFACASGYLDVTEALLGRHDCRPDEPNNAGWTPLFWAVGGGHTSVLAVLLKHPGIHVNHRDKDGRTAASWAAGDGMITSLDYLLAKTNVDPSLADKSGRSALSWAARNGQAETASALLRDSRVDKTSVDQDRRSAISWACGGGHESVLMALIQGKCTGFDDIDADGWTPLMWAVQQNSPGTVNTLLSLASVNIDKTDGKGRTALSWAVEYGHPDVVKALIAAGADVHSMDNEARTPIVWARAFGRDNIVELLQAQMTL